MARLSPDDNFFAVATRMGDIKVWNISPDKKSGMYIVFNQRFYQLFPGDISSVSHVMDLKGHKRAVNWIAYSSKFDKQRAVTGILYVVELNFDKVQSSNNILKMRLWFSTF